MTSSISTSTKDFNRLENRLLIAAIVFATIGALIFIGTLIIFRNLEVLDSSLKVNDNKLGNLGSLVGGAVGAIWNLVGIILFYLTLRLQRKELGLQREELELTRKELQGQREEMKIQNSTLDHQRFENTFFQLLSLHHQIVNGMDLRNGSTIIEQGRDVFKYRYKHIKSSLSGLLTLSEIENEYLKNYKTAQADFGHYFRNLYHIIKFVNHSILLDTDKYNYITIVRAQLSTDELLFLFYNCLSKNGYEKFKPLIEKYHLFKNLPMEDLANEDHKMFYEKSAFVK